MIFMIPMPPTTRLMAAIPPRQIRKVEGASLLPHIPSRVHRNPDQPGQECRHVLGALQALPGPQERFLGDRFGLCLVAAHPTDDSIHHQGVALDEETEGRAVSPDNSADEIVVGMLHGMHP